MTQITTSYKEGYFTPRSEPTYRLSYMQYVMAKAWHKEFRRVLDNFPDSEFYAETGILLEEDRKRYAEEGRKIPEITDLSFGLPVRLTKERYRQTYGQWFTYGVGALEFSVTGETTTREVFEWLVEAVKKKSLRYWDIAYTEGGNVERPIIYAANHKDLLYNMKYARALRSGRRFTTSRNGGVTRQIYT